MVGGRKGNICSIKNSRASRPVSIYGRSCEPRVRNRCQGEWRGSAVMRHTNGDKIIIKRDTDAHYVYFSVRDYGDHGTIIDFVQRRLGASLGAAQGAKTVGRHGSVGTAPLPSSSEGRERSALGLP